HAATAYVVRRVEARAAHYDRVADRDDRVTERRHAVRGEDLDRGLPGRHLVLAEAERDRGGLLRVGVGVAGAARDEVRALARRLQVGEERVGVLLRGGRGEDAPAAELRRVDLERRD